MLNASLLASVSLFMTSMPQVPPDAPLVTVAQGALAGREADGVAAFKNIPYATPPVGPLRWRPPQPAGTWTDVRDAGQVGAICVQLPVAGSGRNPSRS